MLDGGTEPQDTIGQAKRIVPIQVSQNPPYPEAAVDCGIGSITVPWTPEIIGIGDGIFLTEAPQLGALVQKRGRTTELTTNGRIVSTTGQFLVQYEMFPDEFALIGVGDSVFQVVSTDGNLFATDGDSGALITSTTQSVDINAFPIVGMHFMSNDPVTPTLWGACSIDSVFSELNLTTLCTGSVNSLIAGAIISFEAAGKPTGHMAIDRKSEQLRRFRDQVLPTTSVGRSLLDKLRRYAPSFAS